MTALLIIDMQVGSFKPGTPRFDAEALIQRINALSNDFRNNGDAVIFIQHDGTKENSYLPSTSDWNILPTLMKYPDDKNKIREKLFRYLIGRGFSYEIVKDIIDLYKF